ncbi:hypothetical protein [Cerasicoccus frondis]|uniref:hypothetical protein n=1 Tax=Cerasicoccus frondis TaxID=490090 RepID=UPI002852DA0B|nr:hypothetical protein [Cerasicoccus frondis]
MDFFETSYIQGNDEYFSATLIVIIDEESDLSDQFDQAAMALKRWSNRRGMYARKLCFEIKGVDNNLEIANAHFDRMLAKNPNLGKCFHFLEQAHVDFWGVDQQCMARRELNKLA